MKKLFSAEDMKKAVFTIEAAYIVPLAAVIIALLIGFNYHMHERVRNKAVAYEAALFAAAGAEDRSIAEDRVNSKIEQGLSSDPIGVSSAEMTSHINDMCIRVDYAGSVLSEVFGDLFSDGNSIRVDIVHAVRFKRLEWIARDAF